MNIPSKFGVLIAACVLVAVASGCFQANNKFYRESDIVQDKRLEGQFQEPNAQTNSPDFCSLVIKPGENGHYSASVSEGRHWIKLDVVLFKCGTNLFVDISRVTYNGSKHEPAVGPGLLEMLQLATMYHTHSAAGLRFTEKGFQVGSNYGNPVFYALQKYPYLKFRVGTEAEPVDPHQQILTNPTEELYRLLQTEGTNDSVFEFKGGVERSGG